VLSEGGWLADVESMCGGCDDFVQVSLLVINSMPTSINSSRFNELLPVILDSDDNGFNGGCDPSTENSTYGDNITCFQK